MITVSFKTRLARLEAETVGERPTFHVITDISDADGHGGFFAKHRRMKTTAEMDTEEAALRASGRLRPGEEVSRVVHQIVDPPSRDGVRVLQ